MRICVSSHKYYGEYISYINIYIQIKYQELSYDQKWNFWSFGGQYSPK